VSFGLRSAGCTFVLVLGQIRPISQFTHNIVDDMAVNSNSFEEHLLHFDKYLCVIKDSGLTPGLSKISLAKGEITFQGQIIR
jgi:hypothetical protein